MSVLPESAEANVRVYMEKTPRYFLDLSVIRFIKEVTAKAALPYKRNTCGFSLDHVLETQTPLHDAFAVPEPFTKQPLCYNVPPVWKKLRRGSAAITSKSS